MTNKTGKLIELFYRLEERYCYSYEIFNPYLVFIETDERKYISAKRGKGQNRLKNYELQQWNSIVACNMIIKGDKYENQGFYL